MTLAHEGHQGTVKTEKLLHTKVLFPGIDGHVKEFKQFKMSCMPPQNRPDALQMSLCPLIHAWFTVHVDCSPFPTGESMHIPHFLRLKL
jgi:hypothetical protein